MRIPELPEEMDERLYDYQRHEILKKIKQPIVALLNDASTPWVRQDPDWKKVDGLLTSHNNVLNLTRRIGDLDFTVHELLPGVHVIWIADDWVSRSPGTYVGEAILINAEDLKSIREGGMDALLQYHLFKSF